MLVGDIYGGSDYAKIGLSATAIASSFGKPISENKELEDYNPEDIARSLLRLISNNIGQIAYLNALLYGLKRIIFGGFFIRSHEYTMDTISVAVRFCLRSSNMASYQQSSPVQPSDSSDMDSGANADPACGGRGAVRGGGFKLVSGPVIHGQSLGPGLHFGSIWHSYPPHSNPYKAFQQLAPLPFERWSDTEQRYVPMSAMPPPLPKAACHVSFGYHSGYSLYDLRKVVTIKDLPTQPSSIGLTLHCVYGDRKGPKANKPSNFAIPQILLNTLSQIGPRYLSCGKASSNVQERASREIEKHLPYLTFLSTSEEYWSFGINVYRTFKMAGLIKHIYRNRDQLAAAMGPTFPPGWWGIKAGELIRLAHTYRPIQDNQASLSFKFYTSKLGWMPKELLVAVTDKGKAAECVRNVMIFEDASTKVVKVEYPFNEIIWMSIPC